MVLELDSAENDEAVRPYYLKEVEVFDKLVAPQAAPRKYEIYYGTILALTYGHVAGLYGLYLCFSYKWQTLLLGLILAYLAHIGISAGAHRLWSHNAYKAKLPLQILLMLLNSLAFQMTATYWVRVHRLHHRYTDTDADPHNASRGFFYSHMGWLCVRAHEEVKRRGKYIDMSDIYANPVLEFQRKYAIPLIGAVCFIIPTLIPIIFWGESLNNAWHITMLRYLYSLHLTFIVNSVSHLWGFRPYDKSIQPANNSIISFVTIGDGFHNFHHVFPWDYRIAESENEYWNLSTRFIDIFAWIGWAYDLKTASQDIVESRAARTGEGKGIAAKETSKEKD